MVILVVEAVVDVIVVVVIMGIPVDIPVRVVMAPSVLVTCVCMADMVVVVLAAIAVTTF